MSNQPDNATLAEMIRSLREVVEVKINAQAKQDKVHHDAISSRLDKANSKMAKNEDRSIANEGFVKRMKWTWILAFPLLLFFVPLVQDYLREFLPYL